MKTALVTGGAKRIGAAIVKDLATNGYNVAFQYAHSDQQADAIIDELDGCKGKISGFQADLTASASTKAMFEEVVNEFGQIDLLVNNASIFADDSAEKFDEETWDKHFEIHLKTPAVLVSEMAKQPDIGSGLVVNMIDQRVWRLNPKFFSYNLSKTALWTATRTMAQSFAPKIRVNAIGPGPTLVNERQRDEDFQKQVDALLLKAGPQLFEFGQTIRYLDNTPSITGQMIALDGGQHLAWETPDVAGIVE